MRRQRDVVAARALADAAESKRRLEAAAADEVKRQQAIIAQNQFIQQKNDVLKALTYVNFSAKRVCESCTYTIFNFALRNKSTKVIKAISFGWDWYQSSCPLTLSTKKTFKSDWVEAFRLAPGETKGFEIRGEQVAESFRIPDPPCFRVTDVEFD
jgi:hypothetical protein